jgi:hypothetical protein
MGSDRATGCDQVSSAGGQPAAAEVPRHGALRRQQFWPRRHQRLRPRFLDGGGTRVPGERGHLLWLRALHALVPDYAGVNRCRREMRLEFSVVDQ